jgi:RNA polymerase sigma factor (TIGR02999 family)
MWNNMQPMDDSSVLSSDGQVDSGFSSDRILPLVYDELRRLASLRLNHEWGANQTLQPTALVHEVWLRLNVGKSELWKNEGHFFGAAARAMRRILVERARFKSAAKRTPNDDPESQGERWYESDDQILMIHECLEILEKSQPDTAEIVLLKFYGGLSTQEIADTMKMSIRSVERQWMYAKAQLFNLIRAQTTVDSPEP